MKSLRVQPGPPATWVLVLDEGERFPQALERFAREHELAAAHFSAIGAFERATLGWFDLQARDYERIELDEQLELVSLSGNVARAGGGVKVHAHAVVARRSGKAYGGHVLEAVVRPTLELVLEETPARLVRTHRPELGLALIDLEHSSAGEQRPIGRRRWAIAEGYLPEGSHGPQPQMASHETACLLNAGSRTAHVALTVFFAEREPAGPYRVEVPPRRTLHLRFDELRDPEPIPRATDYSALLESDEPIVVQHTRLDSRQSENALLSTIAFAGD